MSQVKQVFARLGKLSYKMLQAARNCPTAVGSSGMQKIDVRKRTQIEDDLHPFSNVEPVMPPTLVLLGVRGVLGEQPASAWKNHFRESHSDP